MMGKLQIRYLYTYFIKYLFEKSKEINFYFLYTEFFQFREEENDQNQLKIGLIKIINPLDLKAALQIKQNMEPEGIRKVDLFTSDLYQFTCSYSYWTSGKHEQTATFQVFFRKYPFSGKYVILAGIRDVKRFLDELQLSKYQQQYLKSIFPHMKQQYFDWLRENIKKTISFKSMREGELVFAKQPLITYTGPLAIVQLLETPILNLVGFSSLVATNASRMIKAVHPKKCIQFGTRRAQGHDGAATAAQFAYLGGFYGTSNISVAAHYKIPCVGTMSHAYVTSFNSLKDTQNFEINGVNIIQAAIEFKNQHKLQTHEGELASFLMYAKSFPHNFACLIDSYSTLDSGILNTIIVSKALHKAGLSEFGIRLDSGDLGQQSNFCRKLWNKYFPQGPRLTIIASDDLHEERLIQLQNKGNQIDIFAIGTNIATCKKQPALGLVCKLVELDGTPKMKFSSDPGKATYPAKKTVYRVWCSNNKFAKFDFIALQNQEISSPVCVVDPNDPQNKISYEYTKIQIMNPYWDKVPPIGSLKQCKENYEQSKSYFQQTLQLSKPQTYPVYMTEKYMKVFDQTLSKNKVLHQALQ